MNEKVTQNLRQSYDLIRQGRKPEALAILAQVLRENPGLAEAWYLLGLALDDPSKKGYAFSQVLKIDPGHAHARNQLAHIQGVEIPQSTSTIDASSKVAEKAVDKNQPGEKAPRKTSKKHQLNGLLIGVFGIVLVLGVSALFFGWWMFSKLSSVEMSRLPTAELITQAVFPTATNVPSTPTPLPSPTPDFVVKFRASVCPMDVPLGTRVKCGTVDVPLDHKNPKGKLITLPVVLFQSQKPEADVIFYLQGGPGEESLDWSVALFDVFVNPLLQNYDMVFFDPRGTGRSTPTISCSELNSIFMDSYFQNRSEEEAFKDFTSAWSACRERYLADGIDPADYNTTQSAADVRDIAQALGYEKVNLLGISYGTRLGLTVMRDYPEIVRSVVLDSVVPMEAKMFNRRSADIQYALNKVFTDCAASPRCNKDYPDLANVFNSLIDRFDKNPVSVKAYDPSSGFTYDVKVNGVDMLSAFTWGLHNSQLVPVVPKAIYDIKNGDNTFLTFALGVPGGSFDSMGLGTYFATVCPEQVYATSAREMETELGSNDLFKRFSLAPFFGSADRVFEICKAWGAKAHEAADSAPVREDTPTLILSGEYDPTTPVTTGEMVSSDLPNDRFYIIPGMGHGASVDNACSLSIVTDFFRNPSEAPETSCLNDLQSFEFFLPYDGIAPVELKPVTEYDTRITGVVPAGWKKKLSSNTYNRDAYLFDPTLVGFGSFPMTEDHAISLLTQSFEENGFDETPMKIGTYSANGFDWTIYRTKWNGEPVLLALAQVSNRRTLAMYMVVSAPEQQAFYKGLFIPMLDKLIPLKN